MGDLKPPDRHPLAHWTYHAYRRAKELGLPVRFIEEARDIVVGAFGSHLLERHFRQPRSGAIFVDPAHPVVHAFKVAGDPQIVEIMELAVYLKRLAGVVGFNAVAAMMREASLFETTRLQLAYAYRLGRAGTEILLEPSAQGGRRADIEIRRGQRRYMAECYVPDVGKQNVRLTELAEFLLPKIIKAAKHHRITVRVSVRFARELEPSERRQVEAWARDAIEEVVTTGFASRESEFCTLRVQNISGRAFDSDFPDPLVDQPSVPATEADFVGSECTVEADEWDAVKDGKARTKQRGSRVLFKWPRTSAEMAVDRVSELAGRFVAKLRQTRVEGAGRLLIAQVPEAHTITPADLEIARRLGERLVSDGKEFSALILTARVWTDASRYRCRRIIIEGPGIDAFPSELRRSLEEVDHGGDLLQDCG